MQPIGTVLWEPSTSDVEGSRLAAFTAWLSRHRGLTFHDYESLWEWSTTEIERFWEAVWDYFALPPRHGVEALRTRSMPGAEWFPGTTLNYAQEILERASGTGPALVAVDEAAIPREIPRSRLATDVSAMAAWLRRAGVSPGERVAGFVSNRYESVVALLATAAVGAVWTSCAPDFGAQGVRDRFAQVEPKILVAVDGYTFNGRHHDRTEVVRELKATLTSVERTVVIPHGAETTLQGVELWEDVVARPEPLRFEPVPFGHPLWILFSSGTTGTPKGIIHGHGGIVLEHLKSMSMTCDLGAGDRLFSYCSTSWMVWNWMLGAMLVGATPVLYDGSPTYPDVLGSWRIAAATGAKVFGVGAAYLTATQNAGAEPDALDGLDGLKTVISTGSPLPTSTWSWIYERFGDRVRLDSSSGGTDVCGTFVAGNAWLPVYLGELSGPCLGVRLAAFDEKGAAVREQVGELVITEPMPSMPIAFWDDPDGRRYRAAYFEEFPGVWRHGDWIEITARGSVVISGRSDATLNRGGVRIGTAEIYAVADVLPDVEDTVVVGIELPDGGYYMPMFFVPRATADVDGVRAGIAERLRTTLSRRHVPDEIVAVRRLPRTLTGKKLEVPLKRLLMGAPLDKALNRSGLTDAAAVEWFVAFGRERVAPMLERDSPKHHA